MKRYNRVSSNAVCIIPRKAIAWIILSMALITILSLVLIEMRRILALRTRKPQYLESTDTDYHFIEEIKSNISSVLNHQRNKVTDAMRPRVIWNDEIIEDLFVDHPHCFNRPYLLILVASAPENFERREAIRKSWADAERWKLQFSALNSKTVFLVGKSPSKFLNILLKNENDITEDVLIGDYSDSYRNLTLKVMHGFTWALRHCHPTFLLKTDDDCFVNVPLLLQFLWKYNPVPVNLYAGRIRWSAPVVRDPNSRWYVSSSEYPRQRYAPYANGAGYIFSHDVLKKLVVFSDRMHTFPNEDAYVGAVMNAAGIRPTYSGRFVTQPGPWQMCNFLYLFVIHRVKASRQNEYLDMANKAVEQCSMNNIVKDWEHPGVTNNPNSRWYVSSSEYPSQRYTTHKQMVPANEEPWQMCIFLYLFVIHRAKASRQNEQQDMTENGINMDIL